MDDSPNIFDRIQVRYLVFAWLGLIFYLPGANVVVVSIVGEAPWYWWNVAYGLYAQFLLALVVGLTAIFPVRVPLSRVIGRRPALSEVRIGLILTAFLYFLASAAVYLVFFPLSYWFPGFVTYWLIDLPELVYYDFGEYPVVPNLLSLVSLCILAPVLEEIAFRGIILHRWAHKLGLRPAIVLSSLVFGIVHPDFLGAFAFGLGMCVLYLRTQSLILPILCHATYNFVAWLVEIGYLVKDGPESEYTLEQFQSEWTIGAASALIVVVWAWMYLRKQGSGLVWKLPVS